ncbi:hypothetical protein Halhy_3433 [Haliscomenobacter hydrossis DSM 1100]|uniref:Uncharacterized protein n=1 Tax=Haliscomenobacter hydrossis (strain ATCC 27775 / DSM 1100 / LMG 10767 / O) TaxID=760192 RepID=F4KVH6_HALH1|nr:hypothetical protein Halhy_3433 [Haliscomenobacter hydrossis DSM 1100]
MNHLSTKNYIKTGVSDPAIFMLYHPSRFHLNRSLSEHIKDWQKVRDYLESI